MSLTDVKMAEQRVQQVKDQVEHAKDTASKAKELMEELKTEYNNHLSIDDGDRSGEYEDETNSLHKVLTIATRNWRKARNDLMASEMSLQSVLVTLSDVTAAQGRKESRQIQPNEPDLHAISLEDEDKEDPPQETDYTGEHIDGTPTLDGKHNLTTEVPINPLIEGLLVQTDDPASNSLQHQDLMLGREQREAFNATCPKFSGEDKQIPFRRWLNVFNSVAKNVVHTAVTARNAVIRQSGSKCTTKQIEKLAASLVRSRLTGSALKRVTTNLRNQDSLLDFLDNEYPAPDEDTAWRRLNRLEMSESISVANFANQFEAAVATVAAATGTPMSDRNTLAQFKEKLAPQLRLLVKQHAQSDRSSYAKLKTLAIHLQGDLRGWQAGDRKSSTPSPYTMTMAMATEDTTPPQQRSGFGYKGNRRYRKQPQRTACPKGTSCLDNKSNKGCSLYHTACRYGSACTRLKSDRGCGFWHPRAVRNRSRPGRSESGFVGCAATHTQPNQGVTTPNNVNSQTTFMTLQLADRRDAIPSEKTARLSTFKIVDRDSGQRFTALCDSGSGLNIITRRTVEKLNLRTVPKRKKIATVNNIITLTRMTQVTIEGIELLMYVCNSLIPGVDMLLTPASCHKFGVEVSQLKLRHRNNDPEVMAMMTIAKSDRHRGNHCIPTSTSTSTAEVTATTAYSTNWNSIDASTSDTDLKRLEAMARSTLDKVVTITEKGPMRLDPISIATKEHNPVVVRQRGYNIEETAFIDKWLKTALQTGKVRATQNSEPRYMTNLLPVKKSGVDSDGHQRFRMTQNLAPVNPHIVPDVYPLPTMDDAVRQVDKDTLFFSEIDISDAYHQLAVQKPSQVLSGFLWKGIHYVLTVLAQGAMNAPAAYQRAMDTIVQYATTQLPRSNRSKLFAYFDNVLCLSPTAREHAEALDTLFAAMIHFNCQPNATKSHLWRSRLPFLVFQMQRGSFEMRTDLLQSIRTATRPTTVPELKSFIGLASLLRSYAPELAEHLAVLQPLLKEKRLVSKWNDQHEQAFRTITTKLAQPVKLQYWNGTEKLVMYTDASDTYVSAVILSSNRPVAYWSKALTEPQLKWGIQDTELLAITSTLKRFEGLCRPRHIELHVDNKTVVHWIKNPCWRKLSGKVARMISYIHGFTHTVEHVSTTDNPSDFFSRYCIAEDRKIEKDPLIMGNPLNEETPTELITTVLAAHGIVDDLTDEMDSAQTLELPNLWSLPYTKDELIQSQHLDNDPSVQLPSKQLNKVMVGGIVCVHDKAANTFSPIIGNGLIMKTIKHLHETHGHASFAKMKAVTTGRFHIPRLKPLLELHMKSCDYCMQRNPQRAQHSALQQIKVSAPNERWQMDFFALTMQIPEREDEGAITRHYLNVLDLYSGMTMVEETPDQTASSAVQVLKRLILRYGKPQTISSDNGTHFTSHTMKSFLDSIDVAHILAIPWHAMSNGAVEASNKSIKRMLRSNMQLEAAKYVANSIPRTRQEVPPLAIYIRKFNPLQDAMNPLSAPSAEFDQEAFEERTRFIQQQYAKQFDAKHREVQDLSVGQMVYIRNTTDQKFHGPRVVTRVYRNHVLTTGMDGRRELRTHRSRIKPGSPALPEFVEDPDTVLDGKGEESPNPNSTDSDTDGKDNTKFNNNEEDEKEYEIEKILDHRRHDPNSEVEFRVKWKGYRIRDATWESEKRLPIATITDYLMRIAKP